MPISALPVLRMFVLCAKATELIEPIGAAIKGAELAAI
jgi:hypothetical protein